MITEAIILAGGLGTRLKSVVANVPKCMAPVASKPFLHYVIKYLQQQGITKFIFSLGYKHEFIEAYLQEQHPSLLAAFAIEQEPLGTGGAIKLACSFAIQKNVLIVNGDTFFEVDVKNMFNIHTATNAACTLALKPMQNFDRYGVVTLHKDNSIASFQEKKFYANGLINGGVYVLNVSTFLNESLPQKFSFENEYLEKYYTQRKMVGLIQEKYFIDIGVPNDFKKANADFISFN